MPRMIVEFSTKEAIAQIVKSANMSAVLKYLSDEVSRFARESPECIDYEVAGPHYRLSKQLHDLSVECEKAEI